MAELRTWVRDRARPWPDSGVARAADDPLTLARLGELVIQQHAAEALLARSGGHLDEARAHSTPERVTEASIAVAEAKVVTTEFALRAATTLIELGGTQATLAEHNLDRHWRNARTHTVHDPVRWKPHAIGNHWLNGAAPQRHASL
jgi:alkylation response protein AidB-like acyl-CoA dehydrogenase